MTYKIEKSVPIPQEKPGRRLEYPLAEMSVGDSFSAPIDKETSVRAAASRYGRANRPKRFKVSRVDGVVRCWRVE